METYMDTKQTTERLVSWIKSEVEASGCRGVVIGISGGIDSAVLAVLCRRAVSENILGVIMPCYSCQEDEDYALALAEKFSIPTKKVVLDSILDKLQVLLSDSNIGSDRDKLAEANLKVRLRMLTLYYFANKLNYLVAGSGNRSELTVGYFTKYGDGGVDIAPLANLVKGQVKEMAYYLEVPDSIIERPPSAGLWPGQTDENEMGLRYGELDRYILTGEVNDAAKTKIDAMIAASKHKRFPPRIPDFRIEQGYNSE